MTMPGPSERLAAVSLLIGLMLLVGGLGVLPAVQHVRSMENELAQNRTMIGHLVERAGERALTRTAAKATVRRIAESDRYIRAATQGLAGAALQGRIEAAVAANGGEIRSIRTLPTKTADGMVRIQLSISLSIAHAGLLRTLGELESGEPFLFVDNLQITSAAWRRALLNHPSTADTLIVRVDMYGYMPPAGDG